MQTILFEFENSYGLFSDVVPACFDAWLLNSKLQTARTTMPICAVARLDNRRVINMIVAESTDPAPDGCKLVNVPEETACGIAWTWNPCPADPMTKAE